MRIIPDIEVCENNSSASEKAVFYAAFSLANTIRVEYNIDRDNIETDFDTFFVFTDGMDTIAGTFADE